MAYALILFSRVFWGSGRRVKIGGVEVLGVVATFNEKPPLRIFI
jgi:hypothetical protein